MFLNFNRFGFLLCLDSTREHDRTQVRIASECRTSWRQKLTISNIGWNNATTTTITTGCLGNCPHHRRSIVCGPMLNKQPSQRGEVENTKAETANLLVNINVIADDDDDEDDDDVAVKDDNAVVGGWFLSRQLAT